jgi:hypothetical protein
MSPDSRRGKIIDICGFSAEMATSSQTAKIKAKRECY